MTTRHSVSGRIRWLAAVTVAGLAGCTAPQGTPESAAAPTVDLPAGAVEMTVDRVLDGDSLRADTQNGALEIRLFGINTPERGECGADDARALLEGLAGSRIAVIVVDEDQFGRTVALVWNPAGQWLNGALVARGLAVTVTGASDGAPTFMELLIESQDAARASNAGLWAEDACGANGPRPSVRVELTSPDPPGPDDEVLDDEYVTVSNGGSNDIDLTGWTLRDESTSNRFAFPTGFILGAGDSVDIVSGCDPTGDQLGWCSPRSIWSNRGDSAFLIDDAGRIIATERHRP